MCGIAVATGWDDAVAAVRQLVAGIMHRGDASDGIMTPRPDAAMATRRLRIVDAEHATQPMLSADGRVLLAFNGEIYNHLELRLELARAGVRCRTDSDTEVLANALSVWGSRAMQRLRGMFAFVALDLRNGDFLAARDPLGIKPLYVIQDGDGFLFCSEIRPLLNATETGEVMFLPPGHMLSRRFCGRYQAATVAAPRCGASRSPAELDRILREAVESHLPPDLPFALMFSGGVDSTLIAHYARCAQPEAPGYFLGTRDAPDFPFAASYAERTGFDLRLVGFDGAGTDIAALIPDVVAAVETFEPSVVREGLCSFLLARRIHADGFRVALGGEGADELFAGYVPLELAFAEGEAAGEFVREQCLVDMHRSNLQRIDRCAMRFQLEVRVPFLDPTVTGYALGLGATALVRNVDGRPRGKMPLREIYDLYPAELPAAIRDRVKLAQHVGTGFDRSQTASPWIDFAESVLSDRAFEDGRKCFAAYDIGSKEELLYIVALARTMDIGRVPHLRDRMRLRMPAVRDTAALVPYLA